MRYSKPSAEQTIAYLLPHIQELRSLYQREVEINTAKSAHILDSHKLLAHEIEAKQQLISNNKTILTAYNKVTAENNQLKRELDLMKYRLNLM
jgi:septation ring formation regulator EzrA